MRRTLDLAEVMGVSRRLVGSLENAERTSYAQATLDALEGALGWAPGSARLVLDGGEPIRAGRPRRAPHALRSALTLADVVPSEDETGDALRTAAEYWALARDTEVAMHRRYQRLRGISREQALAELSYASWVAEENPDWPMPWTVDDEQVFDLLYAYRSQISPWSRSPDRGSSRWMSPAQRRYYEAMGDRHERAQADGPGHDAPGVDT